MKTFKKFCKYEVLTLVVIAAVVILVKALGQEPEYVGLCCLMSPLWTAVVINAECMTAKRGA